MNLPISPAAQRATWSEYKGHNMMKTLAGITPSGFFSFVSKLWSGSTSDRKLTLKSGVLDLLTKRTAYINMPPFSEKGNLYVHFLHKSFLKVLEIEYTKIQKISL